jgi:hypothetical protein
MCRRKAPGKTVCAFLAGSVLAAAAISTAWAVEFPPFLQAQPLPPLQPFLVEVRTHIVSDRLAQVHYTFEERQVRYHHEADGKATQTLEKIIEWYPALEEDLDYQRVVSVNGTRVPAGDLERSDRDHEKKLKEWVARVQHNGSTPGDSRRAKEAIEHVKERGVIDELFLLYDIQMLHRDVIGGRPAIVFSLAPRPGYEPKQPDVQLARHFGGRAWIDEKEHQLVRLEMEALEGVSLALGFVARLSKGSRAEFERSRFDDGTWLPVRARYDAGGRLLLVKRIELDQVSEYRNYKPRPIDGIPAIGRVPRIPFEHDLTTSLGWLAAGRQ